MYSIFAVFDSAGNYYKEPFLARSKGEALREFVEAVNDKNTYLFKHPADFTLFHLCDFNEQTGEVVTNLTPVSLGKALEYRKFEPTDNIQPLKLEKTGTET